MAPSGGNRGRVPAGTLRRAASRETITEDVAREARILDIRSARAAATGEIRVLVLADGRRLRLNVERLARLGLEPGVTIPSSLAAALASEDAYLRGREAAVRLLATKPRSAAELRMRLRDAGVTADRAADVVRDLAEAGYVDDLEYARAWLRSRLAAQTYGIGRLRAELREKGVASPLIEQATREVYGEEDVTVAEERRARGAAARRLRAYGRLARDVRVRRLAGFLQRRGFSALVIARVLRTERRHGFGDAGDA